MTFAVIVLFFVQIVAVDEDNARVTIKLALSGEVGYMPYSA